MSRIIENPKQLIMDKAKEILYTEGYAKLSMRTLSKACDIALGTIYNYYPTKKELVIEMMTDYWQDYLYSAELVEASEDSLYIKLKKIFEELSVFIKSFKEIWLTPDFYGSPEYVKGGLGREYVFMEKLVVIIENMLKEEQAAANIQIKPGTYETANFILMNFVTMIQMPFFKYSTFELFLKELIK